MNPRVSFLFALVLPACFGRTSAVDGPEPQPTAAAPSPRAAPADPNDVWLVFGASGRTSNLYAMRADGSQLHVIDTGTAMATAPAFAPDGRSLAFDGGDALYVMDLATKQSRALTQGRGGVPRWSPDGKRLAFTRDVDIWLIEADGSNERPFEQGPPPGQPWYSNYGHPSFVQGGARIVFDYTNAVAIGDVDGLERHDIWKGDSAGSPMVGVSPSGDRLAFCGCSAPDLRVRIVDLADAKHACTQGLALDGTEAVNARPAWGANDLVAYAEPGSLDLWVVPADGSKPPTNVMSVANKTTTGGGYVDEPSWSPPGALVP